MQWIKDSDLQSILVLLVCIFLSFVWLNTQEGYFIHLTLKTDYFI